MTNRRDLNSAIAFLVHEIRPDWGRPGIEKILGQLDDRPLVDVVVAAVTAADSRLDPKRAGTYLARLADDGRIVRAARGLYRSPRSGVESMESVESGGADTPSDSTLSTLSTPLLESQVLDPDGWCRVHHTNPFAGCWTCDQVVTR